MQFIMIDKENNLHYFTMNKYGDMSINSYADYPHYTERGGFASESILGMGQEKFGEYIVNRMIDDGMIVLANCVRGDATITRFANGKIITLCERADDTSMSVFDAETRELVETYYPRSSFEPMSTLLYIL